MKWEEVSNDAMERKENVVEGSLPLGIFSLLGVSLVIWKEASIQRRDGETARRHQV